MSKSDKVFNKEEIEDTLVKVVQKVVKEIAEAENAKLEMDPTIYNQGLR